MPRKKIGFEDPFMTSWLQREFESVNTQTTYRTGLKHFAKAAGIKSYEQYLMKSPEEIESDIKKFTAYLGSRSPLTVRAYLQGVRVFLSDHEIVFNNGFWAKLRKRRKKLKRVRPLTRDRAPTRKQLRRILNYVDVKGRALFLFLASSGCRIGETVQLRIEDMNLEADPPEVFIRGPTTKNGVGERTVFFSYEARDAIKDWLAIKDHVKKRSKGEDFSGPLVFPFTPLLARHIWKRALKKAGLYKKDKRTDRLILHVHSLRKFFRSKIGLELDYTHVLMGHLEYLDQSYRRIEKKDLAKAYLDNMDNVSIYGSRIDTERLNGLEAENQELRREVETLQTRLESLESLFSRVTKYAEFLERKANSKSGEG